MNDLSNTYVYNELSHEDIDMLKKASVSNINKGIGDLLYLIHLNKLPLADKLIKLVNTNKIRFVYDEKLLHATVKWVEDGGSVLVNATPNAKRKRGLDENYNIPSNELYSLIAGAAVFLYSREFCKDRPFIKDCTNGLMEMLGKAVTKCTGGHFSSPNETAKFHYIMGRYMLSKNNTVVNDVSSFVANISGIEDRDLSILNRKYSDSDYKDLETLVENILREEFSWMDKLQAAALIHTVAQMYGASNAYMLESIECVGAIIADHIVGGRPSLFSRYPNLRSIFKASAYNNIVSVLKDI